MPGHDRIRVATWNCFGVPSGLYGLLFGEPHRPARFRPDDIARALAPYDVICVQESFLASVAAFWAEVADRLGLHLWHDRMLPHVLERSVFGGGLAFLTRRPTRHVSFEMYASRGTGFDAWACKGYAIAELSTETGAAFRVINLHLQSDDPKLAPHAYLPSRASQIDAFLAGHMRLDLDTPTIICGDLNVHEGGDEYTDVLLPRMQAHGFVDVAAGLGLHTYTPAKNAYLAGLDPHAGDSRLDYIWTKDAGGRVFRVAAPPELFLTEAFDVAPGPALFASDHFGMGVELELTA